MIFGVTFCFSTKNSKEQFENYCSIKSLAQFLLSVLFAFIWGIRKDIENKKPWAGC